MTSITSDKLIIILCALVGGIILTLALLLALRTTLRNRKARSRFQNAHSRDPTLTIEEHQRRGRLTRSRLLFEEESQRSAMIRKSQRSRASDAAVGVVVVAENVRPARSRSRTWHGESRRTDSDEELGLWESKGYGEGGDWGAVQATVDRTWQLFHSNKAPVDSRRSFWDEGDDASPYRPPTVRLKTPPLLSHPMFRDGSGAYSFKHLSLPAELTRSKTEPTGN